MKTAIERLLNCFSDAFVTKESDNAASQTPIMSKTGNKHWLVGECMEKNYSKARLDKTIYLIKFIRSLVGSFFYYFLHKVQGFH